MIGLAKDSQYRTSDLGDQLFDGRGAKWIALPVPAADGAIEHHGAGDVVPFRTASIPPPNLIIEGWIPVLRLAADLAAISASGFLVG